MSSTMTSGALGTIVAQSALPVTGGTTPSWLILVLGGLALGGLALARRGGGGP